MAVVMQVVLQEELQLLDLFLEDSNLFGETWALTWLGPAPAVSVYTVSCNSWAVLNGVIYGADQDGIHALDGEDGKDKGEAFVTGVLLPRHSFGTPLPKSIRRIFADCAEPAEVYASQGEHNENATEGLARFGGHVFSRSGLSVDWAIGVQGFKELRGIEVHAAVLPRRRG